MVVDTSDDIMGWAATEQSPMSLPSPGVVGADLAEDVEGAQVLPTPSSFAASSRGFGSFDMDAVSGSATPSGRHGDATGERSTAAAASSAPIESGLELTAAGAASSNSAVARLAQWATNQLAPPQGSGGRRAGDGPATPASHHAGRSGSASAPQARSKEPEMLGEAVFAADEDLVGMLRRRPKDVPQLRNRTNFRNYFRGVPEARMRRLLLAAYAALEPVAREAKVRQCYAAVGVGVWLSGCLAVWLCADAWCL